MVAAYDAALAPFGITIAQFSLLRTIARRQSVSLTALGKALELDRSTVGRNVQVLERSRRVATMRGKSDQREAIVTLTPLGVRILEDAAPAWEACQAAIARRLGKRRLAVLRDALRDI